MQKRLRDPLWQFVGVAIAILTLIITIGVSYNIYYLSQQEKFLKIDLLSSVDIIDVDASVIEGLSVTYKDNPIRKMSSVLVTIQNTGDQEIRIEDYVSPLRFVFPPGAHIADVQVISPSPANLGRVFVTIDNTMTLTLELLNPGDSMTLQFTVLDSPTKIDASTLYVEGRIAGVRELKVTDVAESLPDTFEQTLMRIAGSPFLVLGIIGILLIWIILLDARLEKLYNAQDIKLPKYWVWILISGICMGVLGKMSYDYIVSAWFALRYPMIYFPFG